LQEAISGAKTTGYSKSQHKPWAAILQGVADQHGGDGKETEDRKRVHDLIIRRRPADGTARASAASGQMEIEIFLKARLDMQLAKRPVGQNQTLKKTTPGRRSAGTYF
jgi:hypothetical protein